MSPPPKKYIRVSGVMKMNPAYKKWKEREGGGAPATTVQNPDNALPVISSMDDYEKFNEDVKVSGGAEFLLAESTNATIEMMQEPEICLEAGMQPDEMVDELGNIMSKYEVPMGLMNKLMMLSELQSLEFIIDDSGSMMCQSDTKNPQTGKFNTRWQEAHQRLKEMVEILAYVPFNQIGIEFLNRKDRIALQRNGKNPRNFLADAYRQIDQQFVKNPSGTTPYLEKIQETLLRGQGASLGRYFFGDGVPNGGLHAQKEIVKVLMNRQNPQGNPITFISCTNEDAAVEWMKDAEEVVPYCSESDDFGDESREVLRDQGAALPYTKGFHLICQLVAAMNPDDLDAMDESIPFTKSTLDNMLGIENNEESYRHYFQHYVKAQQSRIIEGPSDQLKKSVQWNYQEFLKAPVAKQIPQVQQFRQQLLRLG